MGQEVLAWSDELFDDLSHTGDANYIYKGTLTTYELLTRGFNVILHGRNEAKMQRVVEELRAAVRGKGKAEKADIRYFLADAAKGEHNFQELVAPFKDLHITVVVHNVGGSSLTDHRYALCRRCPRSIAHATALLYIDWTSAAKTTS